MKNTKVAYICSFCSEEFNKWSGMCPNCKKWNTLKEVKYDTILDKKSNLKAKIENLDKIDTKNFLRIKTQIREFDRVLGGGLVNGSLVLLGGDPGIGKSTLTAQIINNIKDAIYVSGEESLEQIKLRIERLKINPKDICAISDTNIDSIIKAVLAKKPKLIIIDSIQTMYSPDFPSTPGSIVQVRECALKLMRLSKSKNICVILVGHVTKDGLVAGPRILEHLVDVVLYLEGEKFQSSRILRTVKNRFGSIDEIGIFEMNQFGLKEVDNPSELFLEGDVAKASGSVVAVTIEGNRPIFIEVQALTSKSFFGYPKRTSNGYDLNKLNLIIAILAKRCKLALDKYDIFLNIAGGLKTKDPGADLAVCMAIASSYLDKIIKNNYCFFGEVGLSGEIRKVKFFEKRLSEAKRLGYKTDTNSKHLSKIIKNIFKM